MEKIANIKVLIATGLYSPEIGGPATYTKMLEEKLCDHGVDLTILPFGTVRHFPKVVRHAVFMWKVWQLSRSNDVIYALDSISVGVPAWLVSVVTGKPFLVRLGGDYAWEQGQQRFGLEMTLDEYTRSPKKAAFFVRALAFIQSFIVKRAKIVIAPSEYLKSIITTWGVDPLKIRVIYSALFPLEVNVPKAVIREQLEYKGTVITTVGRLVPWKGFRELIDVVAGLREEMPGISLVIIGDGPLHAELQNKITQLKLQNHVRLVGRLGKDALGAAIKGSDLFVLNTAYEGLSHQLLEVMDLGVPIITTNIGGNPELITDGISGVLVEVGDSEGLSSAIKQVVANESTQVRLTQNARLRIQDFSQDAVVAKLAELLHSEMMPLLKK
jgi:glycosyltransferase involved in cell wall biosynthesis